MRRHWRLAPAIVGSLAPAGLLAIGDARGRTTVSISCGMVVTTSIVASNHILGCPANGLVAGARST